MRSLIVVLFLAAGLGLLSPARAQDAAGQSPVRVDSVKAEFTQEKHLPILVRPIISKGTFVFQAPASLRWEYLSPVHSVLLMDDGRTSKFIQRNDQFVEEQGMGMESMAIVLQEITGWLDGHITDTPTFKAQVQEGGLIVLTPKEAALARIISRIELRLAGKSGLMESVTLYEGPDSLTKLIFSHGVLNEKIPAATFMKP